MVRLNHFSIIEKNAQEKLDELHALGFDFSDLTDEKAILKHWLLVSPVDMTALAVSRQSDLMSFLKAPDSLNWPFFYCLSLQLLGFDFSFDFDPEQTLDFVRQINLPHVNVDEVMTKERLITAIYLLLSSRGKKGMPLIDLWVSEGLIPLDNHFHFFNDKSLASFDTNQLIREQIWVETEVDSQNLGRYDLINVQIIRPKTDFQLPTVLTASPYYPGTNDKASDLALHEMKQNLLVKEKGRIRISENPLSLPDYQKKKVKRKGEAVYSFTHAPTSSLNDYLLARGFASVYVAGIGTKSSDGFQTSGDYQQVLSIKAAIDWLNGRARAFTSTRQDCEVFADWANGKVATTGKSYLGTLSYGLATTGVDGLEVILAEAGISNWYDYYREGGLVRSPGGYPGEDIDTLATLTYSRNLNAADFLVGNVLYEEQLCKMQQGMERESGDYNDFWAQRNYLPKATDVKCDVLLEEGLQDFNVMPSQTYHFFKALPQSIKKHVILHRGAHIYANSWQSFDYSEIINAYFTAKLLDRPLNLDLPALIVQENGAAQSWTTLDNWGSPTETILPLGDKRVKFDNTYPEEKFMAYSQNFQLFKKELFAGMTSAAVVDLPVPKSLTINGEIRLSLRLRVSGDRGMLSAQVLDFGQKKRLADQDAVLAVKTLDRGRNFQLENLRELPLQETPYQVLSKGFINLQNRSNLTEIQLIEPNQWMEFTFSLQPTIYKLDKGDTLRVLLYSTDFEHTLRDNRPLTYEIDLSASKLILPTQ